MTHEDFFKQFNKNLKIAVGLSIKQNREGLLALEDYIGNNAIKDMELFKRGLRLIVDGTDADNVDRIISNKIQQEKDEYVRILINMQKDALLLIQKGVNPGLVYALLNSYAGIKNRINRMSRDEFIKQYVELMNRILKTSEKSRNEGLLSLKEDIDQEKANEGDIFEYGIKLAIEKLSDISVNKNIQDSDLKYIDEKLSIMTEQDSDEYTRMLNNVKKEAVLAIIKENNTRIVFMLVNSLTDLTQEETYVLLDFIY